MSYGLILIAMFFMALSDILDTFNTVAESRNKALIAGVTAAGSKTLDIVVTLLGADQLRTNGLYATLLFVGAVFATTLIATDRAEAWAAKHVGSNA